MATALVVHPNPEAEGARADSERHMTDFRVVWRPKDLPPGVPNPFDLDSDALARLAPESVVAEGVAMVAEHSVASCACELQLRTEAKAKDRVAHALLCAKVDPGGRESLQVLVHAEPDGPPSCECPCDWPWPTFCAHGIAALVAWQHLTVEEVLGNARAEAEALRQRRARSEVRVSPPSEGVGFGVWHARTVHRRHGGQTWRVVVNSLTTRVNSCECPDFAHGQLGTCKHIEAVLARLERAKKQGRLESEPARAVVWLDWGDGDAPPRPALHTQGAVPRALMAALAPMQRPGVPLALAARVLSLATLRRGDLVVTEAAKRWAERTIAGEAAATRRAAVAATVRLHGPEQPGIKARLHPYQVEGAAFLAGKGRAVLADDMGLGKTLQAIAAARALMTAGEVQRALVVCPASLKHQWAAEIQRFTGMRAVVAEGAGRLRLSQYAERAPFTVVNYEAVMREAGSIEEQLSPDLLVLDEAQRIRNWQTRTAAAVKRLRAPFAFVLTGTPLENRATDLYSLLQLVDPTVLGPLWRFLADHVVCDTLDRVMAHRDLSGLRAKLSRVMLRRTREVVADQLPEVALRFRRVALDKRQQRLHDAGISAMRSIGEAARKAKRPLTPSERARLLAAIQHTRMACNAAGLIDRVTPTSPKLDALLDLVEAHWRSQPAGEGRKLVVFSQFARMTALAERALLERGVRCVRLHGGVKSARRPKLIQRFEQDPEVGVFLSTDAGATGLNLQAASVLVHLELPFNPAVLAQRNGRIHRLGQDRACLCVALVAADSYESTVQASLWRKRQLFNAVVERGAEADEADVVGGELDRLLESLPTHDVTTPVATVETADEVPPAQERAAPTPGAEVKPAPPPEERGEPSALGAAPKTVAPVIAAVQRVLGRRLQRVQVADKGLIALVDHADEALRAAVAQALAVLASEDRDLEVPVAVVDAGSWEALRGVGWSMSGAGSTARSTAEGESAAGAGAQGSEGRGPEAPTPSEAARASALEKLRAVEALRAAGCLSEAPRLLAEACAAALAADQGVDAVPPLDEAVAWAWQRVASGLCQDAAGLLARLTGMAAAPGLVLPEAVIEGLSRDVRGCLDG